jgi:hypothetical protein
MDKRMQETRENRETISKVSRHTVISTLFLERPESRQRIFSVSFCYVVSCLSLLIEKGIASTSPVFSQHDGNAKRPPCG